MEATAVNDISGRVIAAVPTFDELMWPLLEALRVMGGSATNEELLNKVIELEGYPADVQAVQHTDGRQSKLNYNLAWAKTYLKKVSALSNSSREQQPRRLVADQNGRAVHKAGRHRRSEPRSQTGLGRAESEKACRGGRDSSNRRRCR
jgi:hypothetical protein